MTSAIATSATAVAVTVRTYERSDAACRAGPMRRLMVSRTVRVPDTAARREAPWAMRVARAVAGT